MSRAKPGRGVCPRVLHVLLKPPADVLHFGAGIQHVLLRRLEIGPQRSQGFVELGLFRREFAAFEQLLGHTCEFLLDRFVAAARSFRS
jgi:hypothetical protein